MSPDRRAFLKRAGAALSAVAAAGCAPEGPSTGEEAVPGAPASMDPTVLRAVGALVLPSELGEAGREQAVQAFEGWAYAYEPVPELSHGYGTSEIRYGPPDPVPAWSAQLEALDAEARKRHGAAFSELDTDPRLRLLTRHVGDEGLAVPDPVDARHVAIALLAWWLATPEATDRCYGVRISPQTCRGIANAPEEPEGVA